MAFVLEDMVDGQVFHASVPLTDAQAEAPCLRKNTGQPKGKKSYLYKTKMDDPGVVERFKARLVFR